MGQPVLLLSFIAVLGGILGALSWLAARTRRRGVGMEDRTSCGPSPTRRTGGSGSPN